MPKYLLQHVGNDADLTFVRITEAWLDGYRVADRQLENHPIKITQNADLTFAVSLNLPRWMRLAGRNLRQDVLDYVEACADAMSSTEDLANDDCLVYDTDRPWAEHDPIIIADDGSRSALLPTKPRPQAKTQASAAAPQASSQAGVPDQQTQNILVGQGLTPLPAGHGAVQALAGTKVWKDAKSLLASDPDYEEEAEDDPRGFVSNLAIEAGFVPVEATGLDALIDDLGLPDVTMNSAASLLSQAGSIAQSLGAGGVSFAGAAPGPINAVGGSNGGGKSHFGSDPQVQALMQAAGLKPLPSGQAAVQAMAGDPSYQMLKNRAPILGSWEATGDGLWQAVIGAGYFPVDEQDYQLLAADIGMPGAGTAGGPSMGPAPSPAPTGGAPKAVQSVNAAQLLATLGGSGPKIKNAGGGIGVIHNPTQQDVAALQSMVSQHGTSPQGLQAIMAQMTQNASKAPAGAHPIQAGLGTAQPAGPGPRVGAGAFTGPTWLFRVMKDPDLEAAGLTSVVIVSAAEWRATHTRPDEEISDLVGDDLPDSLIEDEPGHFVSEEDAETVRAGLMATVIFAEDATIG